MKSKNTVVSAALVSLVALGMLGSSQVAFADKKAMEKCYGVVKAGKNDCQTATSSCAGTSKVDRAGDAFIAVPKGTCDKIAGSSLKPKS